MTESISLLPPPPTYCSRSSMKVDVCIIAADKICTLKLCGRDAVSMHLTCLFRGHAYRAFNVACIQIVKRRLFFFFFFCAGTYWMNFLGVFSSALLHSNSIAKKRVKGYIWRREIPSLPLGHAVWLSQLSWQRSLRHEREFFRKDNGVFIWQ